MKDNSDKRTKKNQENIHQGAALLKDHSLFKYVEMPMAVTVGRAVLGREGAGRIVMEKTRYNTRYHMELNHSLSLRPEEWAFVIAHLYLHLAFGHFDAEKLPGYVKGSNEVPRFMQDVWNVACDVYIDKFLRDIKLGKPVGENPADYFPGSVSESEQKIYSYLITNSRSFEPSVFGMAAGQMDMEGLSEPEVYDKTRWYGQKGNSYSADFAKKLAYSLSEAVSIAGGHGGLEDKKESDITKAAAWFLGHYPLLGGIAASFKIIQDIRECRRYDISVAAIDVSEGVIYANPAHDYSQDEWRFILAHEYLHAGLGHASRLEGRDPYLWNVACDYVINGWLMEMGIGTMPQNGLLYDRELSGKSAEEIYDMIIEKSRKFLSFETFRGYGKGDVIFEGAGGSAANLDDFCKSALMQGLEYHMESRRGTIPYGLVEEIRALAMPAISWDVKLANWFDKYIQPAEKHRSYAHPSRRQGSTPDIPRPRYVLSDSAAKAVTFGVVIDTSGSMDASDIGKALGSAASYSAAKNVSAVRVVFCDAAAYDAGYMTPEEIAGRVKVSGRGGTVIQPAIDLLENAPDFPRDGPILIITDGFIENHLTIKRTHAYLIPRGRRLPFGAKGEVFYYE